MYCMYGMDIVISIVMKDCILNHYLAPIDISTLILILMIALIQNQEYDSTENSIRRLKY